MGVTSDLMPVVTLTDVSHRFAEGWVLLHIDLTVAAGDRVLLVGDNGGGKTTLLRLCATAIEPTRGRVQLLGGGGGAARAAARRRVALMTHHHYFYEALSAEENLALVATLHARGRLSEVPHLLDRVGLTAAARRPVQGYSAGMKRRLAMARVLLIEPDLALLDEPFSQLDPRGVDMVEGVLDLLAERGTAVVMATHDHARGSRLATHTLALEGGEATWVVGATGAGRGR